MNSVLISFSTASTEKSPIAYFKHSSKPQYSDIISSLPNTSKTICFTDQILISEFKNIDNYYVTETCSSGNHSLQTSFLIRRGHYTVTQLVDYLNKCLHYLRFNCGGDISVYEDNCFIDF